jgi:hypothetical protein
MLFPSLESCLVQFYPPTLTNKRQKLQKKHHMIIPVLPFTEEKSCELGQLFFKMFFILKYIKIIFFLFFKNYF